MVISGAGSKNRVSVLASWTFSKDTSWAELRATVAGTRGTAHLAGGSALEPAAAVAPKRRSRGGELGNALWVFSASWWCPSLLAAPESELRCFPGLLSPAGLGEDVCGHRLCAVQENQSSKAFVQTCAESAYTHAAWTGGEVRDG